MKHWDKYDLGGVFDVFDFDEKMALINLDMIYEYAVKLDIIVTEESNLEEWVKMKLTRIEQNVSDVAHSLEGWEKFDEGGMIFKKQLLSISKYANKLIEMIKGGSKLMSWQENKLAISANDIDNLYHHLDYKVGNRASQNKFATGGIMEYPDLSSETPIVINEPNNQKISEIDIALIDIALVRQDFSIEKTKIGSSKDAYEIFKQLWNKESINVREEMNLLFLNNANEPIGYYEHTKGAINATLVDVEMIGALALKTLSKGVILAHNHPSGNNRPSEADIKLYQQVKTALKMFNVTVLDSMILVPNSDNYYSLADNGYEMGGMVLSNKEIIKNIDFSDNTDRRLGRYDFSFETEDSEGASILDYDGYIIEAPSSSRMNDEIEWGQNVPEDWENAEKYILDEFYNWKLKRFKNGGGVDGVQISVNAQRYLEMLEEMYPKFLDIDTTTPSKDINKAISELEEKGLIKRLSYNRGFAEYGLKDKKYATGGGVGEILSDIDDRKYSTITKEWGDIHIIPTSDSFWDEIKILLDKSNIKYTAERYDVGTEYFKIKDKSKYANGGGVDKRKVYIETFGGTHFVTYLERKKGQHYTAAQFSAVHTKLDYVKKWIKDNGFELVENPKKTNGGLLDESLWTTSNPKVKEIEDKLKELGFTINAQNRYGKTINENDYITGRYDKFKNKYIIGGIHKFITPLGVNSIGIQHEFDNEQDFWDKINEYNSKMSNGGGVGNYKVGDMFIGTPNAKYDESWQLYKPSISYVIDNKTNKIISIHNTPYEAIKEREILSVKLNKPNL